MCMPSPETLKCFEQERTKGRPLIDWSKPIETVDGQKARRIAENVVRRIYRANAVLYMQGLDSAGREQVVFVNDFGFSENGVHFIRNVLPKMKKIIKYVHMRRDGAGGYYTSLAMYNSPEEAKMDENKNSVAVACVTFEVPDE